MSNNPNKTTIYIGNLNYKRDEDGIKRLFSKYGHVSFVYILKDKKTKLSKGVAFVDMPNKTKAIEAISVLNGSEIDGRTVKVSIAQEN
jgi:U11/U12 small nuclear ribonucleoprotein SNRNP31